MKNTRLKSIFFLILILLISLNLVFYLNKFITHEINPTSQLLEEENPYNLNLHGIQSILDGNITGTGSLQEINYTCKLIDQYSMLKSENNLIINPGNWSLTDINFTIDLLRVPTNTMGENDSTDSVVLSEKENEFYAMPFTVPSSMTYIYNVTVNLYINRLSDFDDLILYIWNSSFTDVNQPKSQIIGPLNFDLGFGEDDFIGWVTLIFPIQLLGPTANSTYYVSFITGHASVDIEWNGKNDVDPEPDEFTVWSYDDGSWINEPIDLTLITGLGFSVYPSEIDLKINGTNVKDISIATGYLNFTFDPSLSGDILFMFEANTTFETEITYLKDLQRSTLANSTFIAKTTWVHTEWNSTAIILYPIESFNRKISWLLPNWNIEQIWNGSSPVDSNDWNTQNIGGHLLITISDTVDGNWVIECNSTNYISQVSTWSGGLLVNTVNTTDTITTTTNFSQKLSTGQVNLTVFPLNKANYNDSSTNIIGNTSVQFKPWRILDTAAENPGQFKCQVSWYNGTEVGINVTTLTVLSVPTKLTLLSYSSSILAGESVFVYVNFSDYYTNEGLTDASLLVKNNTDSTPWSNPYQITMDYGDGSYEIEVITLGMKFGNHSFSINMSKLFYLSSKINYINFTIGGGISNVTVNAPNCFGIRMINSTHAIADPAPYHNSTVKLSIFYFSNLTGEPLRNAIIRSNWVGGGPEVYWIPAFFGYYNITLDVTGFHSETNHTLKIEIQELGYQEAELYVIVPVRKLPTIIEPFETSYGKYLEETFIVYALFEDTFNNRPIPYIYDLNGNFTIKIDTFSDIMQPLTSSMGIYLYTLTLSALGLEEGQTYNITLFAYSKEHEFAILNISLYIIPKYEVNLELIGTPTYLLAGNQFNIYGNLTITNGPPIINTPLIFRIISDLGSSQSIQLTNNSGIAELHIETNPIMKTLQIEVEYLGNTTIQNKTIVSAIIPIVILNSSLTLSPLPAEIMQGDILEINATLLINETPIQNEIIHFTFTYEGSSRVDEQSIGTDETGVATVSIKIPSGVSKIYLTAIYDGISYVVGNQANAVTQVISVITLIWRYSPIWLSILAVITGSVLAYNYLYRRPKLKRLRSLWKKSAEKFKDASNLDFLMIILKESGVSIYNYSFKGEQLDYALMGGFLTAISTFHKELLNNSHNHKKVNQKDEWEINYYNFKICGITLKTARFVLILEDTPSEELRNTLHEFGKEVEKSYSTQLMKYSGNILKFKSIDQIVPKYFEVNLIQPNISRDILKEEMKRFSDLERKIYNLSKTFIKERGYFFTSNLFESANTILKEEKNHILDIIYSLVSKKYFIPITLDDLQKLPKEKIASEEPPVFEPFKLDQPSAEPPKLIKKKLQKILTTAKTAEEKNYLAVAITNYQKAIPLVAKLKQKIQLKELLLKIKQLKEKQSQEIEEDLKERNSDEEK